MILESSPHSKAVAQLYPLDMDAEQNAIALELDQTSTAIQDAGREIFPLTTTACLERWEDLYSLTGAGSLEERRAALMAAYNADSGIAQHHYEALAASMGFNVSILPPKRMFRAGLSHVGQPIYDADEQWTWTVVVPAMESESAELVAIFEQEKIPFTAINWRFLGVFELSHIDVAEISMMTADGSNNQSTYQLTAYDTMGNDITTSVQWISSSASASVVDGLITALIGSETGTGAQIIASWNGVNQTCLVTVFDTFPAVEILSTLRGGTDPGQVYNAVTAMDTASIQMDHIRGVGVAKSLQLGGGGDYRSGRMKGSLYGGGWIECENGNLTRYYPATENGTRLMRSVGNVPAPVANTPIDIAFFNGLLWLNGVSYSPITTIIPSSDPVIYTMQSRWDGDGTLKKCLEGMGTVNVSYDNLIRPGQTDILHCWQNWIRYNSGVVRVPNLGTLGDGYDYLLGDMPSGWFNP